LSKEDKNENNDDGEVEHRVCSSCGNEVRGTDIICPNCGDVMPDLESDGDVIEERPDFIDYEESGEELKEEVPEGLKMILGSAGDMIERKVLSTVKEREEKLRRSVEKGIRENERKFVENLQKTAQQLQKRQDEERERLESRIKDIREEKKELESQLKEEKKDIQEEIEKKEKELKDRQEDIIEENKNFRSKIEEIREKQIETKENLREEFEEKSEELKDRILEENKELNERLKEKKNELEEKIQAKDEEIEELKDRIDEQTDEFEDIRKEIKSELQEKLSEEQNQYMSEIREEMVEHYEKQMDVLRSMKGGDEEEGSQVGGVDIEEELEKTVYPFTAIVGQERMKRSLLLNAINPEIEGVLIWGPNGTAKKTAILGLAELVSDIEGLNKEDVNVWDDPERYISGALVTSKANADYLIDKELNNATLSTRLTNPSQNNHDPMVLVSEPESVDRRLISHMDNFNLHVRVEPLNDLDKRIEISRRWRAFREDPENFYENYKEQIESLRDRVIQTRQKLPSIQVGSRQRGTISNVCAQNDLPSNMDVVIEEVARTITAYDGRDEVLDEDIQEALDLTLVHRVTDELIEEV